MSIFDPINSSACDELIQKIEWGTLVSHPQVYYCKVNFNDSAYDDDHYSNYGIEYPSHIRRSVLKRRAEHLAGRFCCQYLFHALQLPGAVSHHEDRSPCWPPGVAGSISHCKGHSIALVTNKQDKHPGVDVEILDKQTLSECADMFSSNDERNMVRRKLDSEAHKELLIFSAKESFFKAVYPQVKFFFGFEYATIVDVNAEKKTFILELTKTLIPARLEKGMHWVGNFNIEGELITTCIVC